MQFLLRFRRFIAVDIVGNLWSLLSERLRISSLDSRKRLGSWVSLLLLRLRARRTWYLKICFGNSYRPYPEKDTSQTVLYSWCFF